MRTCKAENCNYPVFSKGYCKGHQWKREDKKPIKIKPFSEKRAKINREQYLPQARLFIKDHPVCNIHSPVCTGRAQCVNHRKGKKTIDMLNDITYWESSCYACNNYIEQYDEWARQRGHKLNTFK